MMHLDVSVEQLSAVHVLQRLEELVHDILLVDLLQNVCPDDSMQVCLHVVEHQVDIPVILGLHHIQEPAQSRIPAQRGSANQQGQSYHHNMALVKCCP